MTDRQTDGIAIAYPYSIRCRAQKSASEYNRPTVGRLVTANHFVGSYFDVGILQFTNFRFAECVWKKLICVKCLLYMHLSEWCFLRRIVFADGNYLHLVA